MANEAELAREVATLILGFSEFLDDLAEDPATTPLPVAQSARDNLVAELREPTDFYHRDGWVFQMISWLAAREADPGSLIRAPQPRMADKGLDGLILYADNDSGYDALAICEDKATKNPRKKITDKVWPEIAEFESGVRDHEITSEVTALLRVGNVPRNEVLSLLKSGFIQNSRRYRVSVTVEAEGLASPERVALFKGYDKKVVGTVTRRQGETMCRPGLRAWMTQFANRVADELESM